MSDQSTNELMLNGLDGGNSLAFLAALGTFRVANQLKPITECRMKWTEHEGAWRPVLVFDRALEEQTTFVETLDRKLKSMVDHPAFQLGDNLNVPPDVFREYAKKSVRSAHTIDAEVDSRVWVDFAAAFGCDKTVVTQGKKTTIDDTAFRTMSGAGHQHFLKFMRALIANTDAEHLESSLFFPWTYQDEGRGANMRWDPEDDRRYALRWQNPSTDPSMTMRGANRLAIEALPLFLSVPTQHRLETTGFTVRPRQGAFFTWPIWRDPISNETCRNLLALDELQAETPNGNNLRHRGIEAVYRCKRITIGKFRNFTPSQIV